MKVLFYVSHLTTKRNTNSKSQKRDNFKDQIIVFYVWIMDDSISDSIALISAFFKFLPSNEFKRSTIKWNNATTFCFP